MPSRRSYAALQLASVAAAFVLVGHWIGYRVAVPDAHLRDAVLLSSGHAYWLFAVKCALVLGIASLAASAFDALRRSLHRAPEQPAWRARPAGLALVVIQVASFAALEVGERILASEPLAELFHHNVFLWGLVAQLAIAPLGALLLASLGRALSRVARAGGRARVIEPRGGSVAWPALAPVVPSRDWRGAFAVRGPPA